MLTGHKPEIQLTFHLNLVRNQDKKCINQELCNNLLPLTHYNSDFQNEKVTALLKTQYLEALWSRQMQS